MKKAYIIIFLLSQFISAKQANEIKYTFWAYVFLDTGKLAVGDTYNTLNKITQKIKHCLWDGVRYYKIEYKHKKPVKLFTYKYNVKKPIEIVFFDRNGKQKKWINKNNICNVYYTQESKFHKTIVSCNDKEKYIHFYNLQKNTHIPDKIQFFLNEKQQKETYIIDGIYYTYQNSTLIDKGEYLEENNMRDTLPICFQEENIIFGNEDKGENESDFISNESKPKSPTTLK